MLPEYALNTTNGKLHTAGCHYVKDDCVRIVSTALPAVFRQYGKCVTCCKICLKNDEKAKNAVEKWNRVL